MANDGNDGVTMIYRVMHNYDIGNQDDYIQRLKNSDVDAIRAALYCQFKCEEWFSDDSVLTNLGIAALLVKFYGFRQAATIGIDARTDIDMHFEREAACGKKYDELMEDASLHREGLREFMIEFID